MDKTELKKNRLDLQYSFELQKVNIFLGMVISGVLGFIGTFVWLRNYLWIGVLFTIIIITIGLGFYKKTIKNMTKILTQIENL